MKSADRSSTPKIGDQTLKGMFALGLDEVRNVIYSKSNVAEQSVQPGVYGVRSYGDVAHDRMNSPQRSSLLAEKIKQVELARDGHERESPELSRE